FRRQLNTNPLPEGGRIATNVNGDVKDRTAHHANQLSLRLIDLVMQSAKHVALRAGVVVLHEMRVNTDLAHLSLFETFQKKAPVVAKNIRFDNQYSSNLRSMNFHEL